MFLVRYKYHKLYLLVLHEFDGRAGIHCVSVCSLDTLFWDVLALSRSRRCGLDVSHNQNKIIDFLCIKDVCAHLSRK